MTIKINNSSLSDPKTFEALFREFFKPLTHYSLKMVNDLDSAKEIVHTVFISLWENREKISLDIPIRSYLYTAVHNRSLNFIRNNKKFYKGDFSDIELTSGENEDKIIEAETDSRITDAINSLPPRCSEIFKLSRLEGKKYKEIANDLGISIKTVEIQMSKALKVLRDELKDYLHFLLFWIISNFL
ncbi:MAG: RNA polymerase sigma-70 factor [Bacteroidales bacterium]|nr:RNA polymerase sigma-70 factor [Bacteroidales bacterium]MCF8391048.1 RNA polymerase sigma-70 factor [Bacteroidales bacterium]